MKQTLLTLCLALPAPALLTACSGSDEAKPDQELVDSYTIALVEDALPGNASANLCVMRAKAVDEMPEADEGQIAEAVWDQLFTKPLPSPGVRDWWVERLSVCVG